MNSIVIVSKNQDLTTQALDKICNENKIDPIDQDTSNFEKAVGIEDVRNIQKKLYLKPIKSKDKAVIINAPQGMGIEAQNALLKILEEPPQNTFIVIVVENKNSLLETVLSRCGIIEIKEELVIVGDEISKYQNILISLSQNGIGGNLELAQNFGTSREEALIFLEKLIFVAREKLIKNPKEQKALYNLNKFQEIYNIVKTTNATPRLTLENLFLSL